MTRDEVRHGIPVRANPTDSRIALVAFCVALIFLAPSQSVLAGALDKLVLFNIQAQPLDKALLEFGEQAHVQLSFASDLVTVGLRTQAVKGTYPSKDALAKLLMGSGLTYVAHNGTVEILRGISSSSRTLQKSNEPTQAPVGNTNAKQARGILTDATDPPSNGPTDKNMQLAQVVITGSRIQTTLNDSPQETEIYDRETIDQSGQTSIADFLSTLPDVPVMAGDETSGAGEPYSTVRLRGLPAGTTLVLLNGRRLESSGLTAGAGSFFNLDDIPLAAVQRIEVDPNGSSAIYGSDAIAGVVNIILKKDFDGIALNAQYRWAKDTHTVRTDAALGKQWSRGGISVIGTYETDSGLLYSDRFLTSSQDYTSFGGPNNNYPVCSPGNVFTLDGSPLPGAPAGSGATFAAVTGPKSNGTPDLSGFTYGTLNTCSILAGSALLPSRHRAGVLVEGHLDLAPAVELFTEVLYTHLHQVETLTDASLFGIQGYQEYTVAATNPYNPFGESVGVAELLPDVPVADFVTTNFFRPLVGLRGNLAERWHWEISAWQSTDWDESLVTGGLPNAAAIQTALDSSNPATALNPFVNGPIAPQAVLAPLFGSTDVKVMGQDRSAEAFIRGPVLELPAGSLEAVVGGDYVQSTLYDNLINDGFDPANTRLRYRRRYGALFGEARIPLIGKIAHLDHELLNLTVAGRHDHYSDFGSANTEQVGVELRPVNSFLIRASYADAFDAPTLTSLYTADVTGEQVINDAVTGLPELVPVVSGGNQALRPMTGQSHTEGILYSSRSLEGLVASVTAWSVVENNVIQPVPAQVIVDNAGSFPGRIVMNSAGQISEVNDTYANFGSLDVAGLDYQLAYTHKLGGGRLSIDLDGTQTYRYRQALVAGVPPIEAVSTAEDDGDWAPRWKGTAGVGWKERALSLHFDGRYTGTYLDYDSTRRIGNFWIFDANARFDGGEVFSGAHSLFGEAYLEFGATNILNRAPQFSNYGYDLTGYDATQMSIVGRSIYVNVGGQW